VLPLARKAEAPLLASAVNTRKSAPTCLLVVEEPAPSQLGKLKVKHSAIAVAQRRTPKLHGLQGHTSIPSILTLCVTPFVGDCIPGRDVVSMAPSLFLVTFSLCEDSRAGKLETHKPTRASMCGSASLAPTSTDEHAAEAKPDCSSEHCRGQHGVG
jgi:hypothetical protein